MNSILSLQGAVDFAKAIVLPEKVIADAVIAIVDAVADE